MALVSERVPPYNHTFTSNTQDGIHGLGIFFGEIKLHRVFMIPILHCPLDQYDVIFLIMKHINLRPLPTPKNT